MDSFGQISKASKWKTKILNQLTQRADNQSNNVYIKNIQGLSIFSTKSLQRSPISLRKERNGAEGQEVAGNEGWMEEERSIKREDPANSNCC